MIPKSDAMAAPASANEFDQEIVDMASYVHQYKVDSDLAVSFHPLVYSTKGGWSPSVYTPNGG